MSDSLRLHGLQHARLPCPSLTPEVYRNSCSLSRWCHPAIPSSVIPFSSHLQSFPKSGSFKMSQFFASGRQNIGASASTSVFPMNTQDWSPLEWIYAPINVRTCVCIYTLIHVPTNTHTHRELYKYRRNLCTCFWMCAWCIPQSPTVFSSLSSVTCVRVRTKVRWKGQPAL